MSYIERSLLPNEHIVRRGRLPQPDWLGLVLPAVVALWFPG